MTFEEAKQHAQQHSWWSEDAPGKYQYSYYMHSFVEQRKYYHPQYLSVMFWVTENGFAEEKTPSDERLKIYKWVKQQYQTHKTFLYQLHKHAVKMKRIALAAGKCSSDQLTSPTNSKEDTYIFLMELKQKAKDFVRWGTFIECIDDYNSFVLPKKLEQALPHLTQIERTNILMTLATPQIVSFMETFELKKAKLLLKHRKEIEVAPIFDAVQNKKIRTKIIRLLFQYQWISVNYAGSNPLNAETLFKQLHNQAANEDNNVLGQHIQSIALKIRRIRKEQKELLHKYQLPKDILEDFEIIRSLGGWMDERKETMVKINWYIYQLLNSLSQFTNVQREDLADYSDNEIDNLVHHGTVLDKSLLNQRHICAVYATEYDGDDGSALTVFTGNEAHQLASLLRGTHNGTIKGIVASRWEKNTLSYIGTVQIVMDVTKDSFERGNILVTSMTRPEFVPLLKHAAAIITDEGGLTCHAAIVSRELGIPCIIGTRCATKQLKNKNRISMNLQTGEITQL